MERLGLKGVLRGKKVVTTNPDSSQPCPDDKVNRHFKADRPNQLWVSDFTYIPTWSGTVYVAFVIDVFAPHCRLSPFSQRSVAVGQSGIDPGRCVALAELEAREDTLYVSTGGGFGPRTEAALVKLAQGRQVLFGFDNDAAGDALPNQLIRLLPGAMRLVPPLRVEGSIRLCKDWLDVLNASKVIVTPSPAIPSALPMAASDGAGEAERSMQAPQGRALTCEPDALAADDPDGAFSP